MRLAGILLLIILFIGQFILLARLRRHRVDLEPHESFSEGSSGLWQVNVFHRRNYDASGRRVLGWYLLTWMLFAATFFWLLFFARE